MNNKYKTRRIGLYMVNEEGWKVELFTGVYETGGFGALGKFQFNSPEKIRESVKKGRDRRRGLERHWISFDLRTHPLCVSHHVNRTDLVACPSEIHKHFSHSLLDGSARQLEGVLG